LEKLYSETLWHHPVERKHLVEGVPFVRLQTTHNELCWKASQTISTVSVSTEDLPVPFLCRAPVCWNSSNHQLVDSLPGACSPYSRRCLCTWVTDFGFKYHNRNVLCWGETWHFAFVSCVHFSSTAVG
jgi:hypothetical protein